MVSSIAASHIRDGDTGLPRDANLIGTTNASDTQHATVSHQAQHNWLQVDTNGLEVTELKDAGMSNHEDVIGTVPAHLTN